MEKKDIRVLALDLDGTLTNDQKGLKFSIKLLGFCNFSYLFGKVPRTHFSDTVQRPPCREKVLFFIPVPAQDSFSAKSSAHSPAAFGTGRVPRPYGSSACPKLRALGMQCPPCRAKALFFYSSPSARRIFSAMTSRGSISPCSVQLRICQPCFSAPYRAAERQCCK